MDFTEAVKQYEEEPLTMQLILGLLKGYKRPYDKINELVKKGELTPIKRGFYIPGPKLKMSKPESFLVANHVWGPSYVSMETALSYWGLIPEKVYEISSLTTKTTKTYKTPIGKLSYLHAPLPYYSFGIKSVLLSQKQRVLIASPEKALCDKIVMTSGVFLRSSIQVRQFLLDDMRIGEETLLRLDLKQISSWIADAPKKNSLTMLVTTLKKL